MAERLYGPEPTVHNSLCECGGEGLLPSTVHDERGESYIVWRQCPGTRHRLVLNPGPTMGLSEYLERHPNWLNQPPDESDHAFARRTAWAIVRDPDAIPLSAGNPLAPLVAAYVAEYRKALKK